MLLCLLLLGLLLSLPCGFLGSGLLLCLLFRLLPSLFLGGFLLFLCFLSCFFLRFLLFFLRLAGLPLDQRNHIGAVSLGTLDFSNGLALAPGNYSWRVTLDGDDEHAAERLFCVPKPVIPPVFG